MAEMGYAWVFREDEGPEEVPVVYEVGDGQVVGSFDKPVAVRVGDMLAFSVPVHDSGSSERSA